MMRKNNASDAGSAPVYHIIYHRTAITEYCDYLLSIITGEFLRCLRCVPPRKLRTHSEVNQEDFRMRIIPHNTDTTLNPGTDTPKERVEGSRRLLFSVTGGTLRSRAAFPCSDVVLCILLLEKTGRYHYEVATFVCLFSCFPHNDKY